MFALFLLPTNSIFTIAVLRGTRCYSILWVFGSERNIRKNVCGGDLDNRTFFGCCFGLRTPTPEENLILSITHSCALTQDTHESDSHTETPKRRNAAAGCHGMANAKTTCGWTWIHMNMKKIQPRIISNLTCVRVQKKPTEHLFRYVHLGITIG